MHQIVVEPLGEAWRVRTDRVANDMWFHSGGQAETAARRLGERLAGVGQSAELRIRLRDGSMAARIACNA